MNIDQQLSAATDQLNRTLGFFSRVDTKGSVVLAIDTAMLAFLVTHAPAIRTILWPAGIAATIAILMLGISINYLYRGGTPNLQGGHHSLVYFREIAARTETKYIDEFVGMSQEAYLKDVLGQIWRNSEILSDKFSHIQSALNYLALSIVPWLVALTLFALQAPAGAK